MDTDKQRLFTSFDLGPIRLRNRFIRTAAFEGMSPGGRPTDALVEHHRRVCEGGVAMTTVAYCSVSEDGRTYDTQLLMNESIVPGLRVLTDAVHGEGGLACLQLGHCGDFSSSKVIGTVPVGPSRRFNLYGFAFCREMTQDDMDRVTGDFASAAVLAAEAGFDAVEVHAGHGYLASQFISPHSNRRDDAYGGCLENRLRFPAQVVRAVRESLPDHAALLVKMNLDDGFKSGTPLREIPEVGRAFEAAGADALVGSGGFVTKTPLFMLRGKVPTRDMVRVQKGLFRKAGLTLFGRLFVQYFPFEENFFMEKAKALNASVDIPVVLLGGVVSLKGLTEAQSGGFDLFALGRATIHNPDFVRHLESGEVTLSDCDHCNRCIAAMDAGGVRCVTVEER